MSEINLTNEQHIRLECLRLLADAPLPDLPKKASELANWVISGSTKSSPPKTLDEKYRCIENAREEACDKIASIISSLCEKHKVWACTLRLGGGAVPKPSDFVEWDGKIHMTLMQHG